MRAPSLSYTLLHVVQVKEISKYLVRRQAALLAAPDLPLYSAVTPPAVRALHTRSRLGGGGVGGEGMGVGGTAVTVGRQAHTETSKTLLYWHATGDA